MDYKLKYFQYNERSILIEWPSIIDRNILESILVCKKGIQDYYSKQKVEVTSSYNSILITYNFTIDKFNDKVLELKELFNIKNSDIRAKSLTWEIPVCYDEEFGVDLEMFAQKKELPKQDIIELHSRPLYITYFIGFLPGFLYLGGLDKRLYLDRKATPNLNVKKGSVAIGGEQTGIYPQDSPGGWYIIGKTPITLFSTDYSPPCFVKPGDYIKFNAIDKPEYVDIVERMDNGIYQLTPINSNA